MQMTETPAPPLLPDPASTESSYRTLQSWYLARLRAEAVELSERSRMTPLARIDTDRKALLDRADRPGAVSSVDEPNYVPGILGLCAVLNGLILIAVTGQQNLALAMVALAVSGVGCGVAAIIAAYQQVTSKRRSLETLLQRLKSIGATTVDSQESLQGTTFDQLLDQALVELSLRERIIADYARDLLFAFDSELQILACNMACVRLLGYTPDQLSRRRLQDICLMNNQAEVLEKVQKGKNGREFQFDLTALSRHGGIVDLAVTAEWSNRQNLYFAVGADASAEKAVERARSEFVSMISHDVRAPLQGVLFAIDTFRQTISEELAERGARALARMEKNVQVVIDLIGELIDFERSAQTTLNLKVGEFELHGLVDEVIDQVRDVASARSIAVLNETVQDKTIKADKARIARVILNLVANALKFSPPEAEVVVSSTMRTDAIEVRVSDQGPGIPKHLTTAIFERYFQIQNDIAEGAERIQQNIPGAGLGLAICKAFVEAHGGLIGVDSTEGKGSTFWFTLPV